ncbi:MAG: hypothetical protein U5K71_13585 [Gracilimonas sp.]|nr:hypothetical protein [Gracilimonas sp.]
MKFFRKHIIQTYGAALLLVGIFVYFLKPAGVHETHDAFALWLQSNLKNNTNSGVVDQIRGLSSSQGGFEKVVRQASALVKANAEDFELPVKNDSQDENEVYQLLIKEWNSYQNSSSGMAKAVFIKQAQPYSLIPADGFSTNGKIAGTHTISEQTSDNSGIYLQTEPAFSYHLSPIMSGTAINAP